MSDIDLRTIEQGNPILEVAVELGIKVRGNTGQCFRSERHDLSQGKYPLFFNVAENTFFCRDCTDVGGGVVDLVCQHRGWERDKAIDWLAHRIEFDLQTRDKYYHRQHRR